MKTKTEIFETVDIRVNVTLEDICAGECRQASKCMHKLAGERALIEALGPDIKHVRVDGALIKFNYAGYCWYAILPKRAKMNLMRFDDPETMHLVRPHSYELKAIKGTRIISQTPERRKQINETRKARIASGTPDKEHRPKTLRDRLVGLSTTV